MEAPPPGSGRSAPGSWSLADVGFAPARGLRAVISTHSHEAGTSGEPAATDSRSAPGGSEPTRIPSRAPDPAGWALAERLSLRERVKPLSNPQGRICHCPVLQPGKLNHREKRHLPWSVQMVGGVPAWGARDWAQPRVPHHIAAETGRGCLPTGMPSPPGRPQAPLRGQGTQGIGGRGSRKALWVSCPPPKRGRVSPALAPIPGTPGSATSSRE